MNRPAPLHLVGDLGSRGGRIDAVDDGAERLRRQIAHQPLFARVTHDGDPIARRHAESIERPRGARHQARIVVPPPFAVEAEMLGAKRHVARLVARMVEQQARRRAVAQRLDITRTLHHPSTRIMSGPRQSDGPTSNRI
jgi:hypothetical protein